MRIFAITLAASLAATAAAQAQPADRKPDSGLGQQNATSNQQPHSRLGATLASPPPAGNVAAGQEPVAAAATNHVVAQQQPNIVNQAAMSVTVACLSPAAGGATPDCPAAPDGEPSALPPSR